MSAIVNTALDRINELYAQIANLPESVSKDDNAITSNLKQSFSLTLESLSEWKEWEKANQKKAKLIRESYAVEAQRNTMKSALKFVKRAMQVFNYN
jgi:archaellum component FlaC